MTIRIGWRGGAKARVMHANANLSCLRSALRLITHAPHPASPRKEAGRGDGKPQFSTNAPEMPSRRRPRSHEVRPPLPASLRGEVR